MRMLAMSVLLLAPVNVFAGSVPKVDMSELMSKIDLRVQKCILPRSGEEAKTNNLPKLVNDIEREIVLFSSSTKYDVGYIILTLGELYKKRVADTVVQIGQTKSYEKKEDVYLESVVELIKERTTLVALNLALMLHYEIVPRFYDDDPMPLQPDENGEE